MHEETNEEEKDKLEEKMSPQLTRSRPVSLLGQILTVISLTRKLRVKRKEEQLYVMFTSNFNLNLSIFC